MRGALQTLLEAVGLLLALGWLLWGWLGAIDSENACSGTSVGWLQFALAGVGAGALLGSLFVRQGRLVWLGCGAVLAACWVVYATGEGCA